LDVHGKDLPWGREFSLCERAGSKIENDKKVFSDTLRVQKTLRDMHRTLVEAIVAAGGGALSKPVMQACNKLCMPGFLSSAFFIRVIFVVYVGAGFYASVELAEFNVPTTYNDIAGILKVARIMLQVKKILRSTVSRFKRIRERAEKEKFIEGKILMSGRPDEFLTPKKKQIHKLTTTMGSDSGNR